MPELEQVVPQKRECENAEAEHPTLKIRKGNDRTITDDQWEKDCEAAFELALPPNWEFQECMMGQPPGPLNVFPAAENCALNAMTRRGQLKGSIKLSGREFSVDLSLMLAVPADRKYNVRKLKKNVRKVDISQTKLKQMYLQYAEELPPKDDPAGPDGIAEEGFLQLFSDIGVDPAADIAALGFSAACSATVMGVCRRREFVRGCAMLQVDNISDLSKKMPEVRENILCGKTIKEVYSYTFGIAVEPPSKVLPMDEAQQYWALLLPGWKLREDFCAWAGDHMMGKAINRDVWMQILRFSQEVTPDLSTFDDSQTWPVVLDDFVEHYRKQKGL